MMEHWDVVMQSEPWMWWTGGGVGFIGLISYRLREAKTYHGSGGFMKVWDLVKKRMI